MRWNVGRLDTELGRALLAVRLYVAQPVGQHDRLHYPQRGAQISRPVALTEVGNRLVKPWTIFRLDREAKRLRTHTPSAYPSPLVCNRLHTSSPRPVDFTCVRWSMRE